MRRSVNFRLMRPRFRADRCPFATVPPIDMPIDIGQRASICGAMTPDELAHHVPRLHHYTDRVAWPMIERHGLLCADAIVERFVPDPAARGRLLAERRTDTVVVHDGPDGRVTLNDNLPLHYGPLAARLDDGLTPHDWLRILNGRVFFWPTVERADGFLRAGRRGGREKLLLTFDTRSLAEAYEGRLDLAPINTGSAVRVPARRGHATFTPASAVGWDEWRRLRGRLDTPAEMSVRGDVPDALDHLIERREV